MDLLTVHYHRNDGNYADASLWTWDWFGERNPGQQEVFACRMDDFGVVFELPIADYGVQESTRRIGFIPRVERSWDRKDGSDRQWVPGMGRELWIVQDDPILHEQRPDISPRVRAAYLDSPETIVTLFTAPLSRVGDEARKERIKAVGADGTVIFLSHVAESHEFVARLVFEKPIDWEAQDWHVHINGYRPCLVVPRGVLFHERFQTRDAMGALHSEEATTFRVFSPGARGASVVLYKNCSGPAGRREVPLARRADGVWEAVVHGNLEGQHYMWLMRHHGRPDTEVADIWAFNMTGHDTRPRITNMRRTDPPGFRPVQRPAFSGSMADAVVYEVHVRDFSIDPNSGAKHPGKFLAFTEDGTHVTHHPDQPTGLAHLKRLGVTHVQLLPIQDFDNFEDRNDYNWGYMTANFSSPDGWYATNPWDDSRIRECKAMVQALHAAGIRVIMDVVYNHTAECATFEAIAPGYYYRTRADGTRWNGSGCGNEFRSEAPMARRFVIDSLKHWLTEYGVDGFRFDLMGLIDGETMRQLRDELRAIEPTILLYGEPWTAGATSLHPVTDKWAVRGSGIGAFNDHFRNALKGVPDGGEPGYVQGAHTRDGVIKGMRGSIDDWSWQPTDSVNYADCHDNLTLWDKLMSSTPQFGEAEHVKMHNLVFGVLALSQGMLFMHAGHEMARSKGGYHNSYNAPDSVNRIEWRRQHRFHKVLEFTRDLIRIRREHPMFRLRTADDVRARVHFHEPSAARDGILIKLHVRGDGIEGETWREALVLVNPTPRIRKFNLFPGEWNVYVVGNRTSSAKPLSKVTKVLTLAPHSLALLAR